MEQSYITQEELTQLQSIQRRHNEVTYELGTLEINKLRLQRKKEQLQDYFQELEEETETLSEFLQSKYGKCTVNIDTGEITPIE